jgi:hypothetical protein
MVLGASNLIAASLSALLLLSGGASAVEDGTPVTCGSSIKLKHKESVSAL